MKVLVMKRLECLSSSQDVHSHKALRVTPSSCPSHKACWEAWFPGQPRGTFPWRRFRMQRWRTLACTSGVAVVVPIARPQAEQSSCEHCGRKGIFKFHTKQLEKKNVHGVYMHIYVYIYIWRCNRILNHQQAVPWWTLQSLVLRLVRILLSRVWWRTTESWNSTVPITVINELSCFTLIVWIKISHTHTLSKDPHTLS